MAVQRCEPIRSDVPEVVDTVGSREHVEAPAEPRRLVPSIGPTMTAAPAARRIVGERLDQRLDVLAGIERADVEEVRPVGRLALPSSRRGAAALPRSPRSGPDRYRSPHGVRAVSPG